jgi:hypothetical protein
MPQWADELEFATGSRVCVCVGPEWSGPTMYKGVGGI